MKCTGITRRIDEMGRVVLPKELRKILDLKTNDAMEIYVEDDGSIILRKYNPACIFCGSMDNLTTYKHHNVCKKCLEGLTNRLDEFD